MLHYSEDIIQQLKSHADIVQIIQNFVPLRRQGSSWVGLCPFHDDSSPSMHVTPSMGIYKCFACGAGGDVLKFIMEHEKMDFISTLKFVAAESNFSLPALKEIDPAKREEQGILLELHDLAEKWFMQQLQNTQDAQQYLHNRDINLTTQKEFSIGWAPALRQGFVKWAQEKGFSTDSMIKAGLAVEREGGEITDRFRNRLIFAIKNLSGNTIGFGGRIIVDNPRAPKYLNSPETPLYNKSSILYGLNTARNFMSKSNEVLVVEGYFDVISLNQGGINNVVAASGTALTENHGRILSRYAQKVFLLFDGDDAGRTAARRSLDVLLPLNLTVRVLLFPQGSDPDDLIKTHGAKKFREYISSESVDFMEFLSVSSPQNTPEEKAQFLHEVRQCVNLIADPLLRQEYLNLATRRFNVARQNLTMQNPVMTPRNFAPPKPNLAQPALKIPNLEARFLKLMLVSPQLWSYLHPWFIPEIFSVSAVAEILDLGLALVEEKGCFKLLTLTEELNDEEKEIIIKLKDEKWTEKSAAQEFLASLIQMYGSYIQNLRNKSHKFAIKNNTSAEEFNILRLKTAGILKRMNELKLHTSKTENIAELFKQWNGVYQDIYPLIEEMKSSLT